MKILLVGGGTGGPTAPLLAVAEEIAKKDKNTEFVFIGTHKGPESALLKTSKINYIHHRIPAGKWRRYFSVLNFLDLFKIILGFFISLYLLKKHKPAVVFGAGSFVQVPVAWAAYFLKIPVVIHQQDLQVLLSTKLVLPIAQKVTVAFKFTAKHLPQSSGLFKKKNSTKKIEWTGNPVRQSILRGSEKEAQKKFLLNSKHPTILVMGGGSGSQALNQVVSEAVPELVKYVQIIHIRGKSDKDVSEHEHYHAYDFLSEDLKEAYAAADLIVSRAGMSAISEIMALHKPSVLIPLPKSAQMQNADLLSYLQCAVAISQDRLTPKLLVKVVRKILWSEELQKTMHENSKKIFPANAGKKVVEVVLKTAKKNHEKK